MRVSFSAEALAEAEQATRWYRERGGSVISQDFVAEVRRLASVLGDNPGLGSPSVCDTRRLHLKRFPYALVYLVQADHVRVIAVAHDRRRPGYWVERSSG